MKRLLLSLSLLLAGCSGCGPSQVEGELAFLRGAVLAPGGEGRAVGAGVLVEQAWTPGQEVTLGGVTDTAPAAPECAALFSVDLGDVSSLVAMGGEAPNTALAWAPDGSKLAVGTHRGEVLVLDGWTGAVLGRRRLAETMAKAVAWAPDGGTLYAAEQSPDAYVHALEVPSLESRWLFRLADELESSPPPPATDVYGVYTLPAAWSVVVLDGGDLLVAGTHSWRVDDVHRNRARLWRLGPDGAVKDAWPEDGPADATLLFPRVDEEADRVAIAVGRSAAGDPPEGLAIGGLQVLRLSDLTVQSGLMTPPLEPLFTSAAPWEAVDVEGDRVLAGYSDGRARVFTLDGAGAEASALTLELGTPFLAGEVPLSAPVSWGLLTDDAVVTVTSDTNIPWGAQTTVSRPPSPHPGANRLTVHGLDGTLRFAWSGEHVLYGLTEAPGDRLLVGAGERSSDDRRDLFGVLVFRGDALEVTCPTDSPVFFRHAAHGERIAVSEVPWTADDGSVLGSYRVTVLR